MAETPGAFGLVGSDKSGEFELPYSAEAVCTVAGLRFAILSRPGSASTVQAKLQTGEQLALGTSYPRGLQTVLGKAAKPAIVRAGSVEGLPWRYLWLDGIYELVASGDSARANQLVIVADDLAPVELMLLRSSAINEQQLAYNGDNYGITDPAL